MFQLEVLHLAQIEVQDISDYYKKISLKLSTRFLKDLRICLENIQSNPKKFQVKYNGVRVSFIKGFPYGVFFKIYVSKIKVIAIVHTSRNPKIWKER